MPINYSKWDALELSDDSDIEVHPNVDKRSFIRAKQTQIHQQRLDRKHRITTLRYEKIINDGLLSRIDSLLKALQTHKEEVEKEGNVDETVFLSLMESTGDPSQDKPPKAPEGVHTQQEQPSYSKMMAALVDQVKGEVEKSRPEKPSERYQAFITEVADHHAKVTDLNRQLIVELTKLEKEEGMKITSESIHTGFDSSHVSKSKPAEKTAEPELLNPPRPQLKSVDTGQSSGADADVEDGLPTTLSGHESDEDMQASATGKKFAKIPFGDYRTSLQFISENPSVLAEKETDGLLVEAFNAQTDSNSDYARQCVHQALLLQYCRQLGKDGVGLFFKRIQTPNHQARKLFLDDVNTTYARIRTRTAELAAQRKKDEAEGTGGVEQIQLHAVDPNTTINIVTPPEVPTNEDERQARRIFETFPPGLQRALHSGSLDKVNEVLGKMSVEEAEEVVEQLGQGGMLSLEEGVIDATTEEGQERVKEIERTGRMGGGADGEGRVQEVYEDPGMD